MITISAILTGLLVACSVWLMLSANLLRFVFGLLLLSNGVNLAIFAAGRLTPGAAPLLGAGGALPEAAMANALPQALLLTAIVIGFGLFAFVLALTMKAYRVFGHLDADRMRLAEPEKDKA